MKIEEAIVFLLASSNYGMMVDRIADEVNRRGLFVRRDGKPVDAKMVYAVIMQSPARFGKKRCPQCGDSLSMKTGHFCG